MAVKQRKWRALKLGQLVTIENRVYRVTKAEPNTICRGCAFNGMRMCVTYVPTLIHMRLPVGYVFKRVRV